MTRKKFLQYLLKSVELWKGSCPANIFLTFETIAFSNTKSILRSELQFNNQRNFSCLTILENISLKAGKPFDPIPTRSSLIVCTDTTISQVIGRKLKERGEPLQHYCAVCGQTTTKHTSPRSICFLRSSFGWIKFPSKTHLLAIFSLLLP